MKRFMLAKLIVTTLMIGLSAGITMHAPHVMAASFTQDACQGLNSVGGSGCSGSGANTSLSNVVSAIVGILSIAVGIAAVIMIIIAGMKFITSGGDSNKVASAKNTVVYAIVGLVVAALAQVIVHFVLSST